MQLPKPINLGISTWQRSSDASLPARIKTSTNYQVGRLARIEGRSKNYDDMILLNQWGRVAEATTSCTFIVRDGVKGDVSFQAEDPGSVRRRGGHDPRQDGNAARR